VFQVAETVDLRLQSIVHYIYIATSLQFELVGHLFCRELDDKKDYSLLFTMKGGLLR